MSKHEGSYCEYDVGVRNRTIKVKVKGGTYNDTLTGYTYEHNGRRYYETMQHGWIERSNFRWDKPLPESKLSHDSVAALQQVRRALA